MDPRLYTIEKFPAYVDAPPNPQMKSPFSGHPILDSVYIQRPNQLNRKPSVSARIANGIRLRYYQYEVTFGLYMMTPTERVILNFIFATILCLVAWGMYLGLGPFLSHTLRRLQYYTTGSIWALEEVCDAVKKDLVNGYCSRLAPDLAQNATSNIPALFSR